MAFLPDTSNAPITHSQATVAINYSTRRAHKMRGANKRSKRDQSTLKKLHLIEQFLGLEPSKQKVEMEQAFNAPIEFVTELTTKKKPMWRCELYVGSSILAQRKGKTSGGAYRAVMEEIAPRIAQFRLDAETK